MVTPDGKLLMNRSVSQILIDNGLEHLVFWGTGYYNDPIHLNDVEPVRNNGPYWRKGDLFLSLRSPSTVITRLSGARTGHGRNSTMSISWTTTGSRSSTTMDANLGPPPGPPK